MIDHGVRPGDRASRLTSLPYHMAVAGWQPATALDVGQTAADADALRPFMARIKVTADDALLADYPARWPARVIVHTGAGPHERRVDAVPGDPARAFGEDDVAQKFSALVAPVLSEPDAQELLQNGLALLSSPAALSPIMRAFDIRAAAT